MKPRLLALAVLLALACARPLGHAASSSDASQAAEPIISAGCNDEAALDAILAAMDKERARLESRARDLDEQEAALNALRGQVDQSAKHLKRALAELEAALARYEAARESARLHAARSLARVDASRAASLVAAMEDQAKGSSLGVLGLLPPVSAGRVLDALTARRPDLAARLLTDLARGPEPVPGPGIKRDP